MSSHGFVRFSRLARHNRRSGSTGLAALALSVCITNLQAAPRFTPAPEQVMLPKASHALSSMSPELRSAETAWRRQRNDLNVATRYAREAFLVGLTEGDLRWYGTAKAALQPWWQAQSLSADGHFMRGLVKQGFHDFDGGLADIDAALAQDTRRAEFWSWRFAIHLLRSQMSEAAADCQGMADHIGVPDAQACQAILAYRTGHADTAIAALQTLVRHPDFQGALAQDWLRFHLGEAQRTAGRHDLALATWGKHLSQRPSAHAVRLAYVELLNAQGQHTQALRWANVPAPTDALLVQQWLAERAVGNSDQAQKLSQILQERFASQAQRKDELIERPRMVFLIENQQEDGLVLAQRNWAIQQEPPDAALLIRAALERQRPQAARPVLEWMDRTGYTDPVLAGWAKQLRARLPT